MMTMRTLIMVAALTCCVRGSESQPNVILCMADDMGWGDTAYNGHPEIKTPHLDQMAAVGLRFDRFYSAAPVCSPTRGSCLTGRHPYRLGIPYANAGHLEDDELTIAEILRGLGYRTGHFGKWHLGTLTKTIRDGRRGGTKKGSTHYSPPWNNGFDVCFSTEAQMPTWNPMSEQAVAGKFWTGPGRFAKDNVDGDASRVVMDRAIEMIESSHSDGRLFFAVIWFHTPHSPVAAGPKHRRLYAGLSDDKQHYYGCLTAMDEQIGRLRRKIAELGVDRNTMLWFCSDNGPAAKGGGPGKSAGGRQQGTSGGLRGRKGSLYEGGVRVPGLLVWPQVVTQSRVIDSPCVTSDYLPTTLDFIAPKSDNLKKRPIDGVSLKQIILGETTRRGTPIGFESRKQLAWSGDQYKLYSSDAGQSFELYDLQADPAEATDIAASKPVVAKRMAAELEAWRDAVARDKMIAH